MIFGVMSNLYQRLREFYSGRRVKTEVPPCKPYSATPVRDLIEDKALLCEERWAGFGRLEFALESTKTIKNYDKYLSDLE
jgi:hypothetical protein